MSLVFAPLSIANPARSKKSTPGLLRCKQGGPTNGESARASSARIPRAGTFDNSLDASVNGLDLTPAQEAALRAEKADFGASHIMEKGKRGGDDAAIDRAVDHAFLSAFRFAMYVSAGMAATSAIAAAL